jgi:hypothetical protein
LCVSCGKIYDQKLRAIKQELLSEAINPKQTQSELSPQPSESSLQENENTSLQPSTGTHSMTSLIDYIEKRKNERTSEWVVN